MKSAYDAIVIGAGINGLTAAAYLARAGRRVAVLERREVLGGVAASEELAPGCTAPPCAEDVAWIPGQIVRELGLSRHALDHVTREWHIAAARRDGGWLALSNDIARTADALRRYSRADADQWPVFVQRLAPLAKWLEALYLSRAPRVHVRSPSDTLPLLGLARRVRNLGTLGCVDLLRTVPMSVEELVDDWFEDDALKGTLAATAVRGVCQGPRSPTTAFLLLHRLVTAQAGMFPTRPRLRGGAAALVAALTAAVTRNGGEILPAAEVTGIRVEEDRCRGVVLADGRVVNSGLVISSVDARRTFLQLLDPRQLDPSFVEAVRNIRYRGVVTQVTLVLSKLPRLRDFPADGHPTGLPDMISIAPTVETIERAYDAAKYGQISEVPYLEVTFPPVSHPSGARHPSHVMSVLVQYTPYHLRCCTWDDATRDRLGDVVIDRLAELFPDLKDLIVQRLVLTPRDLEERHGLTEGSLSHGEMALDQILFMRPVPGWADYRTPIEGLFLCGRGCHPGDGVAAGAGRLAAAAVLKRR